MVVQVLIILFLIMGWRHLGREVSLHAFEIARALGAPMLQIGSSITDIDEALEPLQRTRVRYGEILPRDIDFSTSSDKGQGQVSPSSQHASTDESVQFLEPNTGHEANVKVEQQPRLGLDQEERVGNIRSGILY